jgi:hypothetical protein
MSFVDGRCSVKTLAGPAGTLQPVNPSDDMVDARFGNRLHREYLSEPITAVESTGLRVARPLNLA